MYLEIYPKNEHKISHNYMSYGDLKMMFFQFSPCIGENGEYIVLEKLASTYFCHCLSFILYYYSQKDF